MVSRAELIRMAQLEGKKKPKRQAKKPTKSKEEKKETPTTK